MAIAVTQERRSEASRQAAILNALPANIALIDAWGVIVSVNEAWRQFGRENGYRHAKCGVGLSYLDACGEIDGSHTGEAARGIRAVLSGRSPAFSMEYECDSPSQPRRFVMSVTPLAKGFPGGAVIMHLDVTRERLSSQQREQVERDLRESERRFRDLLANVELLSVMLDRDAAITYCNDSLLRLTGWKREEVIGRSWFDVFMPPEVGDMRPVFESLLANLPAAWHRENDLLTRSGERRMIRWSNSVLRSGEGDVIGTASIGEDITEQQRSEGKIARLNRVYAMLGGISALAIRARDRDELFRGACKIAVEAGAFKMALVGVIDRTTLKGSIVASHGAEQSYLDKVNLTAHGPALAKDRPSYRALRELRPVILNNIESDPSLAELQEDLRRVGARSAGYFPLMVEGQAQAVIGLFAGEAHAFDDEETRLLAELAGNLSFALGYIEKADRLAYLAYYDSLTGLANRSLFLERVALLLRSAAADAIRLALFLVDLERFRNINDSLGRAAGDSLLVQVAAWLTRNAGDASLIARVGPDHFALVIPRVRPEGDLPKLIEKTLAAFAAHSFRLGESDVRIGAKVGAALYPDDGADAESLFRNAEAALKKAKASGDRYLFRTPTMTDSAAGQFSLENRLRLALARAEFVLHYQPKTHLVSGALTGAEALIRWNDPQAGLVPPAKFIPILEETGLIHDVGRWALKQALEDYLRWRAAGLAPVRVAVNVSPLQLRNRGFIGEIREAIGIAPAAADGLELEITESLVMEDVRHSIASLQEIRTLGVRIAIDDFGTGYSSLSYLSRLPVDTLKIDRSFVTGMTRSPEGRMLVSTIITLAHSLKLSVVAEGVETEEQLRLLRLLGCDEIQGYILSEPLPAESFAARFLAAPAGA